MEEKPPSMKGPFWIMCLIQGDQLSRMVIYEDWTYIPAIALAFFLHMAFVASIKMDEYFERVLNELRSNRRSVD